MLAWDCCLASSDSSLLSCCEYLVTARVITCGTIGCPRPLAGEVDRARPKSAYLVSSPLSTERPDSSPASLPGSPAFDCVPSPATSPAKYQTSARRCRRSRNNWAMTCRCSLEAHLRGRRATRSARGDSLSHWQPSPPTHERGPHEC